VTPLEVLDHHIVLTSVGGMPHVQRPLLVCPRCGHRRTTLYVRPGVGIGCRGRDCLNLSYATEGRLKHPACDLARIEELVERFKHAKTRAARERWRSKALAAGAEFSRRGLARATRRERLLDAWASEQLALLAAAERSAGD
jgi:hypothetical protein